MLHELESAVLHVLVRAVIVQRVAVVLGSSSSVLNDSGRYAQ